MTSKDKELKEVNYDRVRFMMSRKIPNLVINLMMGQQ